MQARDRSGKKAWTTVSRTPIWTSASRTTARVIRSAVIRGSVVLVIRSAVVYGSIIRGAIIRPLAFILLAFLFVSSPVLAHTLAAGNGRISGQLLDGTNHNAPLAGQQITLQVVQSGNAQDVSSTTTDAKGNYTFANLATDKTLSYAVYTRYQGAQYVSELVVLDSKSVQQVNLTVYEAMTSTAHVAIIEATVLLHEPDVQKGTMTVSEIFFFKNLDNTTYVGSLDASKGKPNALLFSLPTGARNIILGANFNGYTVIQVDHGFASDAALLPGDSQYSFSYEVPYTTSSYDFTFTNFYPTVQLSVLVPPDIHATTDVLSSAGLTTASQHPYRLFRANKLLANQQIHMQLQGLPAQTAASLPTLANNNTLWLIVGILLMLIIIAVTSFVARRTFIGGTTKRSTSRRDHTNTKQRSASGRTHKHERETDDARQVLLEELLELDKAHEAGKLSKAVYQERRAKVKARLRSLMREQEASRR